MINLYILYYFLDKMKMKKTLIILLFFAFNYVNAQKFTSSEDRTGANANADSIIVAMGLTPELIEADYDEAAYYMTYKYKSADKKSIIIMYEKLPKSDFQLKGVIAKFDNLFKYWKMIDPNADANIILAYEGSRWIKYQSGKEKKKAHIFKDDNDWLIEVVSDF
jgi:hypothetical protein